MARVAAAADGRGLIDAKPLGRDADCDHSRSGPAFAAEANFDAERTKEGLRASKPPGKRARILGPTGTGAPLCGRRGNRNATNRWQ
jgi:hypothetical protein